MGDEIPEWSIMWGAKVKMPVDMPDDMLKNAIETSKEALDACENFETNGASAEQSRAEPLRLLSFLLRCMSQTYVC